MTFSFSKFIKKCKKVVSCILIASFVLSNLTYVTYAKEPEKYFPEENIDTKVVLDDMFYIASKTAEISEDDTSKYILKIKRKGDCQKAEKVKLTMNDINGKYGKNYKIKVVGNTFLSDKVENAGKSKSVAEYITNSNYVEYNYSDAVVDGTITAENQLAEGEEVNITEQESQKLNEDFETFLGELKGNGNLKSGEAIDENKVVDDDEDDLEEEIIVEEGKKFNKATLSLADAFEMTTGEKDDMPEVVTGNENPLGNIPLDSDGYMQNSINEVSEVLNSAYVVLNFKVGQTEKLVEVEVIKDNKYTGNMQVGFNLSEVEGSVVAGVYSSFTLIIIDTDKEVPTYINFDKKEYNANNGYIEVKVIRSGEQSSIATCMIDTEDVTAENTRDYSKVHAKLVFGMGVNERTIKIPVVSKYVEKDSSKFKLKLQEAQGAHIGDESVAYGIIRKTDESINTEKVRKLMGAASETSDKILFGAQDYTMDDIIYDAELKLSDCIYDKRNGGNSSSYQCANGTNGWKMYVEDGSFAGDTAQSYFLASINGGYSRYDYSGLEFNWSKDQENGEIIVHYYDFSTSKWLKAYDKNRETFTNRATRIFSPTWDTGYIQLDLYRYDGMWRKSPTLTINSVKPIKRMFEVNLLEANCPLIIDDDGEKRESKQVSYCSKDHLASFDGAKSDGKLVAWSGRDITVKLNYGEKSIFYIAGIDAVNTNTGATYRIKSNSNEALSQLSFKLDNNTLSAIRSFLSFTKRADSLGGGYNGAFTLKPVLGLKKANIIVKDDDRATIKLWEGKSDFPTGVRVTGGTQYTYNVGDTIRYTVDIKNNYKNIFDCNLIDMRVTRPYTKDPMALEKRIGENYFANIAAYSEISLSPILSQTGNAMIIKVPKAEDEKFDKTFGFFAKKDVTRMENGSYYDYIVDSDSAHIANKQYEFEARTLVKSLTPVWKEIHQNDYEYTQCTYYFDGKMEKTDNVIYLSTTKADDIPYSLVGTVYYEDIPIGGKTTSDVWQVAPRVPVVIDGAHFGITDVNGQFITTPISGKANKYVKYKVVVNGITKCYVRQLSNNNLVTRKYKFDNDDPSEIGTEIKSYDNNVGHITVNNNDTTHPHVMSVTAKDFYGNTRSSVYINDKLTTIKAFVKNIDPNTNEPYKYSYVDSSGDVKEEIENVKQIEFVICDPTSKKEKLVIPATISNADKTEWTATYGFCRGNYSEYKSDDLLYVRIITDKKVGDGTGYDLDGKRKPLPAFQETKYGSVNTGITVIEEAEKKPEIVDIALPTEGAISLPIIGEMSTMINALGMSFGMQSFGNRVRIFFGKRLANKGNRFDGNGKATGDNGIYYTLSNFKEGFSDMRDMINSMGKKRLGTMNIGVPSWTFEPMAGIYFEFQLYHNPQAVVEDAFEFTGGGGYIGCIANFRFTFYFLIMGVPCYVGGDVNISVVGEFGVAVDKDQHIVLNDPSQSFIDEIIKKGHFEHIFRAQIVGSAYAGVGLCGVLGIRGGFSIVLNFIYSPMAGKTIEGVRPLGFSATGAIKFWADVVLLSIPIPVYNWPYPYRLGYFKDLYDKGLDKDSANQPPLKGAELLEIREKPRNKEESKFVANKSKKQLFGGTYEASYSKDIIDNVYDDAQAKAKGINNNETLVVYVDDDKSRKNIERTVLKYTIYDVTTDGWTEPKIVQDDSTADFNPYLCDCGNKILLTWASRYGGLSNDSNYKEVLDKIDIYAVFFDKTTKTFGTIERLTEDNYYDYYPKALYDKNSGDILLSYLKSEPKEINSSGDLLNSVQTELNHSYKCYMYYDNARGVWVKDMYYPSEISASGMDQLQLLAKYKGQRFIKSTIDNGAEIINNPAISDYDISSAEVYDIDAEFKNIIDTYKDADASTRNTVMSNYLSSKEENFGVYVFSVDMDHNLTTKNDSEIFLQLYNFTTHTMYNPVRITNNIVQDAMPRLVKANDDSYLLWIQNSQLIKMVSLKKLLCNLDGNEEVSSGYIQLQSTDKMIEGVSIDTYYPFVDKNNQIYIIWQENSASNEETDVSNPDVEFKQDLYISGYFKKLEEDGSYTYGWSNSNRLTDNEKLNALPEMVVFPTNDKLLMINNQYRFLAKGENYEVKDSKLVETVFLPKSSLELEKVTGNINVDETNADIKYDMTILLKNTGLSTVNGFTHNAVVKCDNEEITIFGGVEDTIVAPGGTASIKNGFNMNEHLLNNLDKIMLEINIKETGIADEGVTSKINVFATEEKYEIIGVNGQVVDEENVLKTIQNGNKFNISGTIKNIGSINGKGNEKLVLAKNGDLETHIYESKTIKLGLAESQQFNITIDSSLLSLENGYEDLVIYVVNDKNERLSDYQIVSVNVERAMDFNVNGNKTEKIVLKRGEQKALNVEYTPDKIFRNGTMLYSIGDSKIASITDDGKLKGLKAGITTLAISTKEYGGSALVEVEVKDVKKPTPKPSGGGGGSGSDGVPGLFGLKSKYAQPATTAVVGNWTYNPILDKWGFNANGKTYVNEWVYIYNPDAKNEKDKNAWFNFDENGFMRVGFWQDKNDRIYYFEDSNENGAKGTMVTGYKNILGITYYFEDKDASNLGILIIK